MATKSLENNPSADFDGMNNPFADFGGIVHGDRFIGRHKEINIIKNRVLGSDYGNLAIIGLPRVGKTSLAWKAIMDCKEELLKSHTIPIFIDSGSCRSRNEFYNKMVFNLDEEFQDICDNTYFERSSKYLDLIKSSLGKDDIQRYFKFVRKIGFKVIYILDEFDKTQDFLDKSDFQFLRELSYNLETHICLVTCSRKDISDIEVKDGAISNFSGVFSEIRLGMFSDDDVDEYWLYFSQKWETDKTYKESIRYLTGNHPWLMDKINFKVYSGINHENPIDSLADSKLELMEALDSMVSTLKKDDLLNDAIQLVIGPYFQVSQKKVEKLIKYAFVKETTPVQKKKLFSGMEVGPIFNNQSLAYICFSDFGTWDFYRRYFANVPYFALWSETENLLRKCVKQYLIRFGENWPTTLREYLINKKQSTFNLKKWEDNFSDLQANHDKLVKQFPQMSGGHLVDFTLTSQIFDLFIRRDWQWFNGIFKGSYSDWNNKFDYLCKLRNPVAHNNNDADLADEKVVGTQYCKEIKESILSWQKANQNKID